MMESILASKVSLERRGAQTKHTSSEGISAHKTCLPAFGEVVIRKLRLGGSILGHAH